MAVRFGQTTKAPDLAALGSQAADRVSNLYNDFVGGYTSTQGIMDGNEVRGARRSLAELGGSPKDLTAASQRLLSVGDVRGSEALADLGLAQEDRAFRQMQYQQGQQTASDTRDYARGRDTVADQRWQQEYDQRERTASESRALQRDQLNARAPDTTTLYDPKTGGAQTSVWNPTTRAFEPVGGVKAPASATTAPRTTTIYDPETGQPQTAQWNPEAQDWKPIGGVKQPAPKSVPAAIQKAEAEDLLDVQTIGQVNSMLGNFAAQIDAGKLTLGPLENVQSQFQNWAGSSSPNSRNYASFTAGLEKMRNESLRLNKGVQTEGDAQRAWNEVFANINDPAVVKQRLQEIQGYNNGAAQFKTNQIQLRRETNGLPPLDVAGMVSVPGKDNGRVPQGTPQQQQRATQGNISEGRTATNQQTGETLIFRGGQWVPAQ